MTIRYAVLLFALIVVAVLCFQPIPPAPAQLLEPPPRYDQYLFPQKIALLSAETNGLVTNMPYVPQDFVKKDALLVHLDSDLVDIEIERYQAQIDMDTGIQKAEILLNFRRESLTIAQELYSTILEKTDNPDNDIRVGSWKELQEAKQLFEDAELEETRARLALKDLDLSIRRFKKNKQQLEIRAPWDGVLVKFTSIKDVPSLSQYKQVEVGEMVQAGQPVVALMKVDKLKVLYHLPVALLPRVSLNQKAIVKIKGLENEPIDARVSYINPRVTQGETVDVEVEFDNPLVLDDQAPKGVYRYKYRPGVWAAAELVFDN
ncbi:MAG: HlyD family efflux transporter periplasmic adaptor subunit [Planctomycetes bacterium]|nr:HlyD family efflux transporter periplasmic adaptor subunit [Planctomycetota bacterium]